MDHTIVVVCATSYVDVESMSVDPTQLYLCCTMLFFCHPELLFAYQPIGIGCLFARDKKFILLEPGKNRA